MQDSPPGRLKEVCTQCGKSYAEGTKFCPADGTELMSTMSDPLVGMILPRRYRIISLLGRGSMSVVYKGLYEPLDQLVAVKMLKAHLVSDPNQAKRFQQEIKTAGALSHPNIVGILDFGVTDQSVPYLIMEYLEGKSISDLIDEQERISVNRVIRMFTQAADALAYAHREGVVHRDIKPSNMIVIDTEEETDVVKIVDFGIAKIQSTAASGGGAAGAKAQDLTATGEILGTPLYMSPEQAQGLELDGRSDIYSLGCVMYHALVGRPPFIGDTAMDTMRQQITSTLTPVEIVRPDLFFPEKLQAVLGRALAKDPRIRYQRMEHLKADLEACGRKDTTTGPRMSVHKQAVPPAVPLKKAMPSPPVLPIIAGVIALLIVGGIVIANVTKSGGTKTGQHETGDPWQDSLAAGEHNMDDGKYREAEASFQKALAEARKISPPDDRLAKTENDLAELYYLQDRLPDAEKLSRDAIKVARAATGSSETLADSLANLSRIECANGKYKEASQHGQEALVMRQKLLGANHQDVADSMQGLAEIDLKRGDINKAAESLSRAQAIAVKAIGTNNAEVAGITNDLGMVRELQKQYSVANDLFTRALTTRQVLLGAKHPLVSDTMVALGTLDYNQRNYPDAEKMFNDALDIRFRAFGERSSKTAEVYSCLAILYDTEHEPAKAEECYKKAYEIRRDVWGATSPKLARSLEYLTRFLREHGKKAEAAQYEDQLSSIQNKTTKR